MNTDHLNPIFERDIHRSYLISFLSLCVVLPGEHVRDEGWPGGEEAVGRGGPCSEREQGVHMRKTSSWISCIRWRRLIGLVGAFAVMSIVMSSGEELKHVPPAAPSFIVLHAFTGGDGSGPIAGLLRDGAGNLYGTTRNGGDSGAGVVFKVSPTGAETVLHSFTGGADGGYPLAGLIRDGAGNLYGTTNLGGLGVCKVNGESKGCGVVFRLAP